jgi:hypothetical protein
MCLFFTTEKVRERRIIVNAIRTFFILFDEEWWVFVTARILIFYDCCPIKKNLNGSLYLRRDNMDRAYGSLFSFPISFQRVKTRCYKMGRAYGFVNSFWLYPVNTFQNAIFTVHIAAPD